MPEVTDPARIAALETALADAQAEVERLRKFERETEMLRDRVAALQQQVISLRPPKVPVIKDPGVSGPPEAFTASLRVEARERALKDARRERTILGAVILLAVTATAGAVFLERTLDSDGGGRSNARGIGAPPPMPATREPAAEEPSDAGTSDGGAHDAGRGAMP